MGISPWTIGDRQPDWVFGLSLDSGVFDITGLSPTDFRMELVDVLHPETPRIGSGTFFGLQAAIGSDPASISYHPSADDVATVGVFEQRVIVKPGTSSQQTFHFEEVSFEE